ncbi:uncharacterized protein EDB91DRAFT_1243309 [Suillus paluster]|uniref:uncharacterized protein n=1 Tax=Suillus paluster TaxID=48578 RepID=UPI001B87E682|nr:uncharacterized protein EDB91DRAFT_1243309 [Suillus paluster]KAG1752550.1 hypothetical protein EDB91DRAFT_1243309 [Suillus paluster]
MGVEASRPPATAPIGSSEKSATVGGDAPQAPGAASSGDSTPDHIKAPSGSGAAASTRNETIMQQGQATVVAPVLDDVKSSAFDAVDATAGSRREKLGFVSASVKTKCNRGFCVQDVALLGPPCTSGNEAIVATGSNASGNVNQMPVIERNLSVIPKEDPAELDANNSIDSISSTIIPESFEASESQSHCSVQQPFANIHSNITQRRITTTSIESTVSPCKNSIVIPDVASTNITSSALRCATEYSIENTDRIYANTPTKIRRTEVPVAVTYADATNLAAQYPDLASQILVSPLRKRTASQEVALTPEQDSIEDSPPSKRRRHRTRRHRRRRSRDNQEESQQQSRGSFRTPGPDVHPSHQEDLSSASGFSRVVDPKGTSRFQYTHDSQQPDWSVNPTLPTSSPAVERAPSLQTNRHAAPVTSQNRTERTGSYQREDSDANWGLATEMQPSTPPPTRFATPKRAPIQEQHGAMLLRSEDRAGAIKATDSIATYLGRRSSNAEMLLTELFRKAMETSSPSAMKVRYPEHSSFRRSEAERTTPVKALVAETAHPVNQAEKIIEGDSPRVKLPVPLTPPIKTSPNPAHKSPAARTETTYQGYKPPATRTEEDSTIYQSYTPPAARTEGQAIYQSYKSPAARKEEGRTVHQNYKPPAARTEEDRTIRQSYKPPHQRINENKDNATAMHTPPIYHASPLNKPYTPPSPRMTDSLERSERIRHLERLLSRERELPINVTGPAVPSPKPAQVLQPIGPWRASDEKAFHQRGAMNSGTGVNQSLELLRAMQAMGVGISPRTDTLAALGSGNQSGRPNAVEHNGFNGVPMQSGTKMTEEKVLWNDLARAVPSQGSRSPHGSGGYRSVSGQSSETNVPVTQWTRYR